MEIEYDIFIDALDLKCPQPLLMTKVGIKKIDYNQVLLLRTTDDHTDLDLEVWCQRFGHTIIDKNLSSGLFWIRKGQIQS